VFEFIYDKGIDIQYGARPLKRSIEREVSTPLARKLLTEKISGEVEAYIFAKNDKLEIEFKPNKGIIADPPFYMENGSAK
jgi:ATP-dependent Clp protease ATP-binding subunit ClpA